MTPLVSIIIPCFNAGRWLAETIESTLAQSWPEKEIIIINDGSQDDSLAVAQRFAARGVRVFDQPNQGASAARNHGLRVAQGEFIQFLDADDLLSPEKIAWQVELLRTKLAGTIASCAWARFSTDQRSAQFTDVSVFRDFLPLDFLMLAGDTGAMMHPAAWLVPRTIADRAGPWDESLTLNDDGEYFCRVLLASPRIAFCPDPRARSYYRSGLPGSLSGQRSDRSRRSQFRSIELIVQHMCETENSDRTRRAAANYFQRFIHDYYPAPAELMQYAATRVAGFGGSTLLYPPMGPRTRRLAAVLGWKNVWRLKHMLGR